MVAQPVALPTRYRLEDCIGAGRSATVWRARDTRKGRFVAIKVVDPRTIADHPERQAIILDRFESEVRSMARLNDVPGVCKIYEVGIDRDGVAWLASEYLDGGSLAERGRPVHLGDWLTLYEALAVAHNRDVAHGDISPSNIIFDDHGSPVLVDFGMSRIVDGVGRRTVTGMTPAFAAPERIRGAAPSAASDIYALAATLSRYPFEGVASEHRFERIVARAMAADPTKRPTAVKVASQLRSA